MFLAHVTLTEVPEIVVYLLIGGLIGYALRWLKTRNVEQVVKRKF